jgi:PAS domain S-box-containing protein
MKKAKRPRVKAARKSVRKPGGKPVATSRLDGSLARLRPGTGLFRAIVDTAAAPILFLSPDYAILELNREAAQLFGLKREKLVGRAFLQSFGAGALGGLTRQDLDHVASGRPVRGVRGRLRQADGSERVLLWNAGRLAGPTGKALGVIAVAQDITELERAEHALREREARMSSIITTAPDAVITIDTRGVIQSFSTAAEKLFGYAAGEVIGHNVSMLMPSPQREEHDSYLARYERTGEKRIIGIGRKVDAQRRDGTVFPVELAVGEVKVGEVHFFTGFIRDLTARAKMEEELRQSQKMEAIGQLTGGLAHDFNNLLTVISGNLEMLEPRLEQADDRALLTEAQEATELGGKLAGRLLAFGRRQPLNPKPIDLGQLVAGMTDLLRRSLGELVSVETRLARDLRTTVADPGQVENALLNLAINARDAMPEGGKLIIETANVELDPADAAAADGVPAGSYAMLRVTDTGTGMTPEVRQRAFEPFFTTKGAGVGSGLGLSMVYGFVKQSGGHVRLYSSPGHGATVSIYLPAGAEDARRAAKAEAARPSPGASGETVLAVEDDPMVRRISVRRLRELGYKVIEAQDGNSALKVIDGGAAIDVLFTDVVMPGGMTGLDLAREARKRRPALKVLFTSGYSDPAVAKGGMLTENADWLGKPYRTGDLAAKLRSLLMR